MKRVLIVDDAIVTRMVLRRILENAGHTVVGEATTGKEGVDKYKELRPDVVTMDIVMPDMDGFDATSRITSFDPDAVVIIMSSIHQKSLSLKAIMAGASSYIIKPADTDSFLRTIEQSYDDSEIPLPEIETK